MNANLKHKTFLRVRLAKLMDAWAEKKGQIDRVHRRMAALGYPETMKPTLFGKFTKFLKQVAALAEKERSVIGEIDAVERQHSFLRERKKLKRFKQEREQTFANDNGKKDAWSRKWTWWFLFFLVLMLAQKRALQPATRPMLKAG